MASETTILACPSCHSKDYLGTLEQYYGTAWASIAIVGGQMAISWEGGAEIAWDSATTMGVRCGACNWEFQGQYWANELEPWEQQKDMEFLAQMELEVAGAESGEEEAGERDTEGGDELPD